MGILKTVWEFWKKVAQFIGDVIARVVLTFFYFTLVLPFGLGVHLFGDPLRLKPGLRENFWLDRETKDLELEHGKKQF